jgi:hypothetical protein
VLRGRSYWAVILGDLVAIVATRSSVLKPSKAGALDGGGAGGTRCGCREEGPEGRRNPDQLRFGPVRGVGRGTARTWGSRSRCGSSRELGGLGRTGLETDDRPRSPGRSSPPSEAFARPIGSSGGGCSSDGGPKLSAITWSAFLASVAEPGRDLVQSLEPSADPARKLHEGQGPHRKRSTQSPPILKRRRNPHPSWVETADATLAKTIPRVAERIPSSDMRLPARLETAPGASQHPASIFPLRQEATAVSCEGVRRPEADPHDTA